MSEGGARKLPEGIDWREFTPDDSPKTPMDVMGDPQLRDLATATLSVGDLAHDFALPVYDFSDGTEQRTGEVFRLADAATHRPVALIFGSYT